MGDEKFVLFSDCIPVKGTKRSIICDLSNNDYYIIPNGLFDILEKFNGRTINFVKQQFKNDYDDIIEEYFNFLLSKKIIFYTTNPNFFPKISLKWDSTSTITNAIIDYENTSHDFESITDQLEFLKCSHIQVRFFKDIKLAFVLNVLKILNQKKTRILSIDFILPYNKSFTKKEINIIIKKIGEYTLLFYTTLQRKKSMIQYQNQIKWGIWYRQKVMYLMKKVVA